MNRSKILVLDFGSQYAHLIAKRFRALGYYSEIALPSADLSVFEGAKGVVFSGGPSSVYEKDVPEFNKEILNLEIPILGLCYGHQLLSYSYGGKVGKAEVGEFGFAELNLNDAGKASPLFRGVTPTTQVWMSHQDGVLSLGEGFEVIGSTKDCPFAALQNLSKKRFSLQCHCEVKDTPEGNKIFKNFADICGMEVNWDEDTVLAHILDSIKKEAKDKNVLLFLSGGVDSTVAFALLNKALGQERVLGLHIDNGFMRKNESKNVAEAYHKFGFNNFIVEDASESFLAAIKGLTDPQKKRMAVGENFISVRDSVVAAQKLKEDDWMLAQGTLYPDIIESGGTKNSHTIKTHHNRVDGIQKLIAKGLIIEPLKDLYKDEVRAIGKKLGLDSELVMRHPFPGPGLSINVLCSNGILSDEDKKELEAAQKELDSIKISHFCEHCTATMQKYVLPVNQ
ncbi:MAG: glutamine-hydrolyzing GMP synthase, partial [Treponema sp.]|nr:glutamine-hydrolyzing GMP synthase [Treponema sp.]